MQRKYIGSAKYERNKRESASARLHILEGPPETAESANDRVNQEQMKKIRPEEGYTGAVHPKCINTYPG